MSENTKIEWCDHTFNPWEGCQKTSPGCDNCYAEAHNARFGGGTAINFGPGAPRRRTSAANWNKPRAWNSQKFYQCTCCGWRGSEKDKEFRTPRNGCIHDLVPARARVFCASLADVFDNAVDPQWRADLFELIRATPNLDWLLLTKRIGNAAAMIQAALANMDIGYSVPFAAWPWPNVWIGATIVNQEDADRDIPKLLAVPARVRFLSMEPLLGQVDLRLPTRTWTNSRGCATCDHCCNGDRCDDPTHFQRGRPDWAPHCRCPYCRGTGYGKPIDWVIVGGESGPNARPMHPDWARSLRDQCVDAGVPFLFKQWGEWAPADGPAFMAAGGKRSDLYVCIWGEMARVGKKADGRLLDGRTWDGFPS